MNAKQQILMHKKDQAPAGRNLSATELGADTLAACPLLDAMLRRLDTLEKRVSREDAA